MEFTIIKQILGSPKNGWQVLPNAIQGRKVTGFNILITIAILAGCLSFIGVYVNTNGDFSLAGRYFGYISIKWVTGIFVASWAVSKLANGFKGKTSFWLMLAILAICSSFLMIFTSIAHLAPMAKIPLYILSAAGLVYYYQALDKLSNLNKEKIPGFILISLLVIAIIIFFIELPLAFFFNISINS